MSFRALATESRCRRTNRLLTVASWLAVFAVTALVIETFPATAAPGDCPPNARPSSPGEDALGEFRSYAPDPSLSLTFDGSGEKQSDYLSFDAYQYSGSDQTKAITPRNLIAVVPQPFKSTGHSISDVTPVAALIRAASGGTPALVRVCLVIDPRATQNLHPGRYAGNVYLRADNYSDVKIPTVVTLRADRSKAIVLAFAGVAIGLVVKLLTELTSAQRSGSPAAPRLLHWSVALAIILGIVTGWLGYIEIYDSNETWGVNGSDSLKLFGTCFGFQMGSIGGADIARRLVG
jgi:hypothetical protein